MASEKENMQVFKTIGAAFFAVGLVCAEILASGCGAEADGGAYSVPGTDVFGQASEGLGVGSYNGVTTFGTSTLDNMACLQTTGTGVPCRWMHPYSNGNFGFTPFRYSAIAAGPGIGTAADIAATTTLLNGTVMPAFNGELAPFWRSWDTSQSIFHGLTIRGADSSPPMPPTSFGDSNAVHYIRPQWGNCQTANRTESPPEPGLFRSCDYLTVEVNYPALHANFAANRFTGNLKQLIFLIMDMAQGAGPQTYASTYSNTTLSVSQQVSTTPFSVQEKSMVEQVAADFGQGDKLITFFH